MFAILNLRHPESAYISLKVVYLQDVIGSKISKSFYGYNRQTLGTFFQVSKKPIKTALFGLRAELQEVLRGGGLNRGSMTGVLLIIVPIFSSFFAVLFVLLSINVIKERRKHKVGIGTGRNKSVERAMRVHANFAEYVPFALLLMALLELNKANSLLLIGLCSVLLVGRLVHAFGVSMENERFAYRVSGMVMTFTVILIAGVANLAIVFR